MQPSVPNLALLKGCGASRLVRDGNARDTARERATDERELPHGLRHAPPHPVDGRSPRKTRRICGAAFFWRARNSARIARTLEKCVSCESALGRVALVANAMGRGRLFPRSGQVRAEPRCLYGVNAIQIRSLQNRIRGPEGASLHAPSEASSRPSQGGCADRPRRGSRTPSRPALAPQQGCGARATDAPVRSGATSGAKRRGASDEGPCRVRGPIRHPLTQDRRAWAEGRRQVAAKQRDCGKHVSVLHNPLLAVPKSEALVFAICKTRFDHAEGDVRPSARLQLASNASDAASTKRDARTTLQERQLTVEQTPRAAMCHLASSSQNRQGGRRGAGASAQRHRLDINKSRLWNRIPKHAT